jgi:hypothetical protein
VKRRWQALSGFIGRKGFRRRSAASSLKAPRLTGEPERRWVGWSLVGGAGIPGVAVKCVDIRRNVKGEGRHLGKY